VDDIAITCSWLPATTPINQPISGDKIQYNLAYSSPSGAECTELVRLSWKDWIDNVYIATLPKEGFEVSGKTLVGSGDDGTENFDWPLTGPVNATFSVSVSCRKGSDVVACGNTS
jgi:hypothetical protein